MRFQRHISATEGGSGATSVAPQHHRGTTNLHEHPPAGHNSRAAAGGDPAQLAQPAQPPQPRKRRQPQRAAGPAPSEPHSEGDTAQVAVVPVERERYIRTVKRNFSITAAQDARLMEEVRAGRAASSSEALRAALADAERYRNDRAESARIETSLRRQLELSRQSQQGRS